MEIGQIKQLNKDKGFYFFSPSTLRFFSSRILKDVFVYDGYGYFITSEQFKNNDEIGERKYTLRKCNLSTGDINTIGEFQQFNYKCNAWDFLLKELGFLDSFDDLKGEIDKREYNNIEGLKSLITKKWYYQLLNAVPPYQKEGEKGFYMSECLSENLYYYCWESNGLYFCEVRQLENSIAGNII